MTIAEWYDALKSFVKQHFDTNFTPTVYVAVSGGRDSIFLTHLLLDILGHERLVVLHMDHSLRGEESDQDRFFVESFARTHRIRYQTSKFVLKNGSGKGGLENIARERRYSWFREVIRDSSCLCCGHTADDHIETILMKLYRGTGLAGLCGIASTQTIKEIKILRPLLSVYREHITQYLVERNIPWRDDASNMSTDYFRNFIRLHVCKLLSDEIKDKIIRISHLSSALRFSYKVPDAFLVQNGLEFNLEVIQSLSNFELRNVIEKIYLFFLGGSGPDKKHMERLKLFLTSPSYHIQLPRYIHVSKAKKKIYFQFQKSLTKIDLSDKKRTFSQQNHNALRSISLPCELLPQLIVRFANLETDQWKGKKLANYAFIQKMPLWRKHAIMVLELKSEILFIDYFGVTDHYRNLSLPMDNVETYSFEEELVCL